MSKIIYIHHYFSKGLFYKIAHNTIDREYHIDNNNTGYVIGKYKNNEIKFVFDPTIHYKDDGLHLLDFWTIHHQKDINKLYDIKFTTDNTMDINFLTNIGKLLKKEKKWIISIFRMEKIIGKCDGIGFNTVIDFEENLTLLKNHYIVSDNIIIDNKIKNKYTNHYFCITNSIHQWNEHISIRWHYEYKNIFEKLNQPYDLCFSMRKHTKNRINLINGLAKLNNNKIYLTKVDNSKNRKINQTDELFEKNIENNITKGDNFSDISWIQNIAEYGYLDYLMRVLPMAKMHILSETWDYFPNEFTSQFLSEKTYGFLLAKIPFISTHTYPLDIIQNICDIEQHPFYNDIKLCNGNTDNFVKFVEVFMENFENNYILCKNWIENAHIKLLNIIDVENSLLNIVINNFECEKISIDIKKNLL